VRARVEERDLRGSLFAGAAAIVTDVTELGSTSVAVRYDFTTRRQLGDWIAIGDDSRVAMSAGRLVVLGEVRLAPGRFLRERLRLRLRVPRSERDPARPNVNVIIWSALAPTVDAASAGLPAPVLFGLGAYFGTGVLRRGADSTGDILLPASLVLSLNTDRSASDRRESVDSVPLDGAGGEPASVCWVESRSTAHVPRGDWITVEWHPDGIRWLDGERNIIPSGALPALIEKLEPLAGRRGTVGLRSFGSRLAIDEIRLEGRLDEGLLRAEARRIAIRRLREEIPGLPVR